MHRRSLIAGAAIATSIGKIIMSERQRPTEDRTRRTRYTWTLSRDAW